MGRHQLWMVLLVSDVSRLCFTLLLKKITYPGLVTPSNGLLHLMDPNLKGTHH